MSEDDMTRDSLIAETDPTERITALIAKQRAIYWMDILTAAWAWSQEEVAQVLGVPLELLREWRNHEIEPSDAIMERLRLLRKVHYEIWLASGTHDPGSYFSQWWRRPMTYFDGGTPIQVALDDPEGLNRVIGLCRSAHW